MTNHYIPFANSATDWPLIGAFFPEAAGCRTTLQLLEAGDINLPTHPKPWVDAAVDGLHSSRTIQPDDKTNPDFRSYIRRFPNYDRVASPEFQRLPDRDVSSAFVSAILDRTLAAAGDPGWVSVPQLPYTVGSDRNRINRSLAEASARWKLKSGYRGKLILPIILSKPGQTDKKTDRNPKVDLAATCFEASDASGVWVVDSTLDDQDGVSNYENIRFPGIIKFHEELNSKLPADTVTVAGPYWGLNLVLWARGLVRFPAIGVGRSFRYYIPGGRQKEAKPRVALAPLRRLVVWSRELKRWLGDALEALDRHDPARADFSTLLHEFDFLSDKDRARRQVARFYSAWVQRLEVVPSSSRALTLYQDLSAAYVLGMGLKPLPSTEKVKSAAKVAKQLMVNCL